MPQIKNKDRIGSEAKRLHDRLEAEGRRFFSVQMAAELGGKTYSATWSLLDHLTRAGWIRRVTDGLYALAGEDLNRFAVGRELAGGKGYYISHGSAMEVWGMGEMRTSPRPSPEGEGDATSSRLSAYGMLRDPEGEGDAASSRPLSDPHPGLPPERGKEALREGKGAPAAEVIVTLTDVRRMRRRRVLGVDYRFVNDNLIAARKLENRRPRPEHWRLAEVEAEPNEPVWVSDPEWTVLSGLARPDLCGGIEGTARAIWNWREKLDVGKLVGYANHIRNRTAVRRLGYVLEALGLQTEESEFVLGFSVFSSYGRLEPGRPAAGELYRKWRLDVNAELTTDDTDNRLKHRGTEDAEGI